MISIDTKNRFFDTELGNTIEISRDRLPGFPHVRGTDRTRALGVVSTSKALTQINIELDDQKGIEDAPSW
jgi:hypothetical protein